MKKFISFFLFMMAFAIFPVYAQDVGSPVNIDLAGGFVTIAAVAALTLTITGYIKVWFKAQDNWARWVSWAVSILLSFIVWYFNLGIFEPLTWTATIIYGFGIGLIANGIFTSETVQALLAMIGAQVKKE